MRAASGDASQVADEFDADLDLTQHDAGAAGDRRPAGSLQRRADHPHAQRAAHAGARRTAPATSTSSPTSDLESVRFRIDGTLREVVQPQQGAARGADLAPEDHGRARHRREAPAAGRPHLAAHRRPRRSTCASRRCRPAHGERAVLRLLDKDASRSSTSSRLGMSRRRAAAVRQADQAAARHRAGDRPDRLGQDDHAVRVARRA